MKCDGPNDENWSDSQDRIVSLTFDGGMNSDSDGSNDLMMWMMLNGGTIMVTLQDDPAVTRTYVLSGIPSELTATDYGD